MTKNIRLLFYILSITIFCNSCSIKRRLYGSGYYVKIHHSNHKKADGFVQKKESINSQSIDNVSGQLGEEIANASTNIEALQIPKIINTNPFDENVIPIKNKLKVKIPKYKNETKTITEVIPEAKSEKKLYPMSLGALLVSIFGLFKFGVLAGSLAITFGIVSLVMIKKEPKTRKGKSLAVAAIVIGFLDIVVTLLFIIMQLV